MASRSLCQLRSRHHQCGDSHHDVYCPRRRECGPVLPVPYGSRFVPRRRYYTVWPTGHVDESLFGSNHREVKPYNQTDCFTFEHPDKEAEKKWQAIRRWDKTQKSTVRIVASQDIRFINVPRLMRNARCAEETKLFLTPDSYSKYLKVSKTLTRQEKDLLSRETKEENLRMKEESAERCKRMKEKQDRARATAYRPTDLEKKELDQSAVKLNAATQNSISNCEEIRKLNDLTQNAKVQTVRDAQVKEKQQVNVEHNLEEKRLVEIMESERLNAIQIQEGIEERRRQQRLVAALDVIHQIYDKEQDKLREIENKEQENERMQRYIQNLCEEDIEIVGRRKDDKDKYRRELDACSERVQQRKICDVEIEKLLINKVIQHQNDKAEREAAAEDRQRSEKYERAVEIDRLRSLQERQLDQRAAQIEQRTRRDQERADRQWRKKEVDEAVRRVTMKQNLKSAFDEQIREKIGQRARQVSEDKSNFARHLRAIIDTDEREHREIQLEQLKRREFCSDVVEQIQEKENERQEERRAWLQVGLDLDKSLRERRCKLNEAKENRVEELRVIGVPEKHLQYMEKKATMDSLPPLFSAASLRSP